MTPKGPYKYKNDMDVEVTKLYAAGIEDQELFEFLGISKGTFYAWMKRVKSFKAARKMGKKLFQEKLLAELKRRLELQKERT